MVERARLESEYTGNRIGGSNPPLSANLFLHIHKIKLSKEKKSFKFYFLYHFLYRKIVGLFYVILKGSLLVGPGGAG